MAQINTTFGFKDQMTQGLSLLNQTLTSMNKTLSSMQSQMNGANQAIDEVRKSSEAAAGSVSGLSSGLLTFNAAIGVFNSVKGAVDSVTASISEMSAAYNFQMTQENKLATVMRARMGATEEQIQSVKDYASALQNSGVIGDEVQLAGAQELATYISDVNTLKALMPVLNDIAVQASPDMNVSGQQMSSLATMLGKVMGGDLGGMSRRGWVFTDEEKAQFQEMSEMQRAQFLAAYAQDAIGNQNQNAAQTAAGQVIQLSNTFGDLKEQIGQALVPYQQLFQISTMKWKITFLETIAKGLNAINQHPFLRALLTGVIVAGLVAIGAVIVASIIPHLTAVIGQLAIIQAFSGPIGWIALGIGAIVGAAVVMEGALGGASEKIDDCQKATRIWAEDTSNIKTDMETIQGILDGTKTSFGNEEALDAYKSQVRAVADQMDSMLNGMNIDWRSLGTDELAQVLRENSFSKSEIGMVERLKKEYDVYTRRVNYVSNAIAEQNAALEEQARIQREIEESAKRRTDNENKIAEAYARTQQGKKDAKLAELEEFKKMQAEGGNFIKAMNPYTNKVEDKFRAYTDREMEQIEVIIKEIEDSLKEGPIKVESAKPLQIDDDFKRLLSEKALQDYQVKYSQITPSVVIQSMEVSKEADEESVIDTITGAIVNAASACLSGAA